MDVLSEIEIEVLAVETQAFDLGLAQDTNILGTKT